jgi:hypothetical protein
MACLTGLIAQRGENKNHDFPGFSRRLVFAAGLSYNESQH